MLIEKGEATARTSDVDASRTRLAYVSLFRIPLVIGAVFVMLPFLALWDQTGPVVEALYDVSDGMKLWVLLSTVFMLCLSVMKCAWLVAAYADRRCGVASLHVHYPVRRHWYLLFGLAAAPTIYSVRVIGQPSSPVLLWSTVAGFLTASALYEFARFVTRWIEGFAVVRYLGTVLAHHPEVGAGYVRLRTGVFFPGHRLALGLTLGTGVLYVVFGRMLGDPNAHATPPTLAYALLLLILLCWALSGLAFFLDRYRLPLLLPIAALVVFTGARGGSDHYFQLRGSWYLHPVSPVEALTSARPPGLSAQTAIVVAANGGGIQAAAWTAQVLTGLQQTCEKQLGSRCRFAQAVRLISSVSGGSVGAMYVSASYEHGSMPRNSLLTTVSFAEASSLEHVGWGLLYRDLFRPFYPHFDYEDRGASLEEAWQRHIDLGTPLQAWRDDVRDGLRPATIFNATVADTGERFLMSTAAPREAPGRRNFESMFPNSDIELATAARLSATFSYVSPVARADTGRESSLHFADGGYYDNYGTASLVDWLDEALIENQHLPFAQQVQRVLILQLRGAPPTNGSEGKRRGWFYQAYAPISTVIAARETGQLSHSDQELALLKRAWAGKTAISSIVMQFCHSDAPLSWHLTKKQIIAVTSEWNEELNRKSPDAVIRFLAVPDVTEGISGPVMADVGSRCQPLQSQAE
jgi:hypothetical protein